MKTYKMIIDPIQVLDALRGYIIGVYEKDLKRLHKNGVTCDRSNYEQAYQLIEQP